MKPQAFVLKALTLFFFVLAIYESNAQVKTKIFKEGVPNELLPIKRPLVKTVILEPPNDFEGLKAGKLQDDDSRFALPLLAKINLISSAATSIEGEYKVYSIKLIGKGALNISIEFSPFFLAENSILSVFTDKEITDSITSSQNNLQNEWNTRVYQGNLLNIVLKEKINQKEMSRVGISRVYFGYKAFGQQFGDPGSSAYCEINVACNLGSGWEEERNSVALINANGHWATGALVMNVCNTNRPYFLTAHHALSVGNVSN